LSKSKDELVSEVKEEESKYIMNVNDMKTSRAEAVAGAKELLSLQVESISQSISAAAAGVGTAEVFSPKGNLHTRTKVPPTWKSNPFARAWISM